MAKRATRKPTPAKRHRKAVLMVRVKRHHGRRLFNTTDNRPRGRPKGAKDRIRRGTKATFKAICEEVQHENGRDIKTALLDGIRSEARYAHNYLKLYRDSIDGPPTDTLALKGKFNDDELAAAKRTLTRKFETMLRAAMAESHGQPHESSGDVSTSRRRDQRTSTDGDHADAPKPT